MVRMIGKKQVLKSLSTTLVSANAMLYTFLLPYSMRTLLRKTSIPISVIFPLDFFFRFRPSHLSFSPRVPR